MEKYRITVNSYYNNQYRNIFREFESQDNLNKYVSAINNSGYSKVVGIKNVTEQRIKEDLINVTLGKYKKVPIPFFSLSDDNKKGMAINEIYKTDVKLHHSYKSVYYQLKHLSVERIESILDEIKHNHYICTIN